MGKILSYFSASGIVLWSWKLSEYKQFLAPNFVGERTSIDMRLQIWLSSQHVTKLGWLLLGDLPLQRLAKKQHTAFIPFPAFADQKFMKFWDNVEDPSEFRTPFPLVYGLFPQIFAIKSRNRRKSEQMYKVV